MTWVLDTSAYSAFNRGDQRFRKWFNLEYEIIVPVIVVGELRAGFAAGSQIAQNETLLQRFLDSPNVRVATLSDKTTSLFAKIYAGLRKSGRPIGINDMWIAAMALEAGHSLLTLDSDFSNIAELGLVTL